MNKSGSFNGTTSRQVNSVPPRGKAASKIALATAVAISIGAVMAPQAQAGDRKIYPGTLCEAYSGGSTPNYIWGQARNLSATSTMTVECPVVRDRTTSSDKINNGQVRALDQSSSANVSCTLYSAYRTSTGSSYWFDSQSTSGSSSNDKALTFGSVPYNWHTHVFYRCTLPAMYSGNSSRIVSYYVTEK